MFEDIVKTVLTNVSYSTHAFRVSSDLVLLRPGAGKVVNLFRLSDEQLLNVGTINTTANDWVIHTHAVTGSDGKVYLTPTKANRFYRVNLSTMSLEEFGSPKGSEGYLNFFKSHVYGDYIIYVPQDYNRVVRYHIPTDTMDDYGDPVSGYGNATTLYGDALWMSPYNYSLPNFKKFDLLTGVASNIGSPLGFQGFNSWVWAVGNDNCLYTIKHGSLQSGVSDRLVRVDPISESWSFVGTAFGNVSGFPLAGMKPVGNYIYLFVRDIPTGFIRFDTVAQDWETVPGSFSVSKLWSSMYDGGDYISGRTRDPSGYQVIYDFSGGAPVECVLDLGLDYDVNVFGDIYTGVAYGNSLSITNYPLYRYTERLGINAPVIGANF